MKFFKHHAVIPGEKFSTAKLVLTVLAMIIGGIGVILISRGAVPIYSTNWTYWGPRIKGCESGQGPTSGGNYVAQNSISTASGAYQFLDSTWDGYKGYAKARLAPPAVQEERAVIAFKYSGTAPWVSSYYCWQSDDLAAQNAALPSVFKEQHPPNKDLDPLIPGVQDVTGDVNNLKIVHTPPADGLDPYVGSPIVQFLRLLGFLRA